MEIIYSKVIASVIILVMTINIIPVSEAEERSLSYSKIVLESSPTVHKVIPGVEKAVHCGRYCAYIGYRTCKGFQLVNNQCKILSTVIEYVDETTPPQVTNENAYKLQPISLPKCTSNTGYNVVIGASEIFCLMFKNIAVTYDNAKQDCISKSGTIMFTDKLYTIKIMQKLFGYPRSAWPRFWIGAKLNRITGDFDGEENGQVIPLASPLWYPGYPDNSGGNEVCLTIHGNGQLNDIECGTPIFYVCQIKDIF